MPQRDGSLLRNRTLLLVGLTSLLTDISSEMVYPLLPVLMTGVLGASKSTLGLVEGVAESVAQVTRVFSGAAADRTGRAKALAVGGYAGSAFGKVFVYLASVALAWPLVFVGRVIDRLGKGVRAAPRDAIIAACVPATQRGRAFGFHRAMDTTGTTLGVLVAYIVFTSARGDAEQASGIRAVLLVSIVPAVLGVAALCFVRDGRGVRAQTVGSAPAPDEPESLPTIHRLRAAWAGLTPRLKGFLAISLLAALGGSSNQFLMLRAHERGFDEAEVILLYLLFSAVYMGSSYPAGLLSDRAGRRALLVTGYGIYGAVYLGMALVGLLPRGMQHASIWVLFGVYGLHIGLTEGVEKALIVDLAPRQARATILGLHSTIVGLALLPASLLAGILWDAIGPAAPFVVGAATGLVSAVALRKAL